MIKIYLDNCCYNRPFDDNTQDIIQLETQAIIGILNKAIKNQVVIYKSKVHVKVINPIEFIMEVE